MSTRYHYVATDRVNDGGVTVDKGDPLGIMDVEMDIDPRFAASLVARGATHRNVKRGQVLINDHLCDDGLSMVAGCTVANIQPVRGVGIRVFAALVAAGKARVANPKKANAATNPKAPSQVAFKS